MDISRRMLRQMVRYMEANDVKRMPEEELLQVMKELEEARKAEKNKANGTEEEKNVKSRDSKFLLKGRNPVREWAIWEVHCATGWSRAKVVKALKEAKESYGISFKQYCKYKVYNIPSEGFREIYDARVALLTREKEERREGRKQANHDSAKEALLKIVEKTGWTEEEAKSKVAEAKERTGCSTDLYYYFKFYEKSAEEQNTYLTQDFSKTVSEKYDTNPFFSVMLADKERTNYFFKNYIKRPWCVNTRVTKEEFKEIFANEDKVFYKPLHDHHGNGSEPINLKEEGLDAAYDRLKDYTEGVVEGYVKQSKRMNELAPRAVNTLRIVTISSQEEDGTRNKSIVYISLKMSGETGCVDNLAGGGMVAAVNMETGKLDTYAADENDRIFKNHPVTGTEIKGFEVPFLKEAMDMVYDAIEALNLNGYLGWDVAITDEGPELIETNTKPGVVLYQLPYAVENKGVKDVLAKYL